MTIIAFEGIDASGKTTLAQAVKEHATSFGYNKATIYTYPYQTNRTLPQPHQATKEYPHGFDHEKDWLMWAMSYYTQMHYLTRTKLSTHTNELIILDRWYYSTPAYSPQSMRPKQRERILSHLAEACRNYYITGLRLPDLWVYCKTDPAKPLRRPPLDDFDRATPAQRQLTQARYDHYFRNDANVTTLDTDQLDIKKCVEIIYRRLRPSYFLPNPDDQTN